MCILQCELTRIPTAMVMAMAMVMVMVMVVMAMAMVMRCASASMSLSAYLTPSQIKPNQAKSSAKHVWIKKKTFPNKKHVKLS